MAKRVAINGFGRIGRLTFRHLMTNKNIEVVAVNDLTDNKTLAHLLKYDSIHGKLEANIEHNDKEIIVNGNAIKAFSERDPAKLPWKDLQIDVVLECTGFFRKKEQASLHLDAGAKRVILSAPAKSPGIPTIVLGVNEEDINPADTIISNASCTTNCLSPMVKIIDENWGLEQGFMTTVHAYTSNQRIQDAPHKDLRRARAAAENIIPTTTGAATALGLVYPKAKGKITAISIRVPVPCGSLTELNCTVSKDISVEDIQEAFKKAASGKMKGILEYSEEPLVSSDIVNNPHSCIIDGKMVMVDGKMIKVIGWYDNEYGYAARMADLVAKW